MRILIAHNNIIPAQLYGGTERVIWDLGKELHRLKHQVSYLVKQGSRCDFAQTLTYDENRPLHLQIPDDIDIVHFNFIPKDPISKPYLITLHGNTYHHNELDKNTVFVSKNHAQRHNSNVFVYNGLDWSSYMPVNFSNTRKYFHFLGKAAWRLKNVKGAIEVIRKTPSERLKVLGGVRFNFKMGIRFTFSPRITFYGMVGGTVKNQLLNGSKGLVFPVIWNEPFGLAIIESLYYGCPIFATPYGSLNELVPAEVGFLSNDSQELAQRLLSSDDFNRKYCHQYAVDLFNSKNMALAYLSLYEKILNGKSLHDQAPCLINEEPKFLPWK